MTAQRQISPHPTPARAERSEPAPATQQIRAGTDALPPGTPVVPPIHITAAYAFDSLAQARERFAQRAPGLTYSRTANPTVALFEQRICALEGGRAAVATASGQAALALTFLALAGRSSQSPDGEPHPETPAGHIVASERIYGGTADLLNDTLAEAGISVTWVDPHDEAAWRNAITARTRGLIVESIANPHADLADIPALAHIAHEAGMPLIVDNTLASPHLVRPGELGADIVVHSATKYIAGSGSAMGGVIVDIGSFPWSADPQRWPQLTAERVRFGGSLTATRGDAGALTHLVRAQLLNDLGPCLSPTSAQQLIDGLATLDIRIERHCRTAEALVARLEQSAAVTSVAHPSAAGSPSAALAARDFPRGTGAVLSFELGDDLDVEAFFDALRLFSLAVNLGDARSMACHPATMTHCRLTPELRAAGRITDRTVRLAVGREDVSDLWADLEQAFAAARTATDPNSDEAGCRRRETAGIADAA